MSSRRRQPSAAGSILRAARGFFRIGWVESLQYPLGLGINTLTSVVPVVAYYFLGELGVGAGASAGLGSDYFTFAAIGVVVLRILAAGLNDLSASFSNLVDTGQFELILMEPVRPSLLTIFVAQWLVVRRSLESVVVIGICVLLGANFTWHRLGWAIGATVLGILASVAVGTLAAAVRLLAKRADPVAAAYALAAMLLSGSFYPVDVLPEALQIIARGLPHTYLNVVLREFLMIQPPSAPPMGIRTAMLGLAFWAAVLFPLSVLVFGVAVKKGKEMGVISAY